MRNFVLLSLSLITLSACGSFEGHRTKMEPYKGSTGSAGIFKVGNPYRIAGRKYTPQETYNFTQTGIASWYGPNFDGKRTANGEIYDQNALTAAHKTLQMPSLVRVTNLENGRSIIVRVNDRGPFSKGRIIDMSKRGAELLQFKNQGTAKVKVQVLPKESRALAEAAKRGIDTTGSEIALNQGQPLDARFNKTQPAQFTQAAKDNLQRMQQPATFQPEPSNPVAEQPVSLVQPVEVQSIASAENIVKTVPVTPNNIFVQAGSFSSADNANQLAAQLKPFGNAQVIPTQINSQQFFRVRFYADDVNAADNILSTLTSNGYNQAIIVVE